MIITPVVDDLFILAVVFEMKLNCFHYSSDVSDLRFFVGIVDQANPAASAYSRDGRKVTSICQRKES